MKKSLVSIFEGIYPLIIYYAIISFLSRGLLHFSIFRGMSTTLLTMIIKILCIPFMYYFYSMARHTKKNRKGNDVITSVIMSILLGFLFCMGLNYLVKVLNLINYSPAYKKIISVATDDKLIIRIIAACIVAPILEELVYRGILFYKLNLALPKILAILISAAVFGVAHFNLVQGVYAGLLGVVFAIIYDKTGDLWMSILAHATANAFALFSGYIPIMNVINASTLYTHIVGIAALFIGIFMLIKWNK